MWIALSIFWTTGAWLMGNPKTLTPGPRTPTTDWVCRLPMDQSTDYSYGPSLRTTPQNRIKIRNKYFTYWLSNRLLVSAKFWTLVCKCIILGFRLGHKLYHYTLPFPLLWPYSIWKTGKPPGSLWEASKFVLFPLCQFFQPILRWIRELIPGFLFLICSVELQIRTSINNLTTYLP